MGGGLALAGAFFVVRAIASESDVIGHVVADADWWWLAAGVLLAAAAMVTIAMLWRVALRLVGAEMDRRSVVAVYFQGELAKYVPGGPWAVVGRAELARRRGLGPAAAYGGVALSLAGLYLATALLAAVFLLTGADGGPSLALVPVLGILVVGFAGLHPRVVARLVALSRRVLKGDIEVPRWGDSLVLVVRYLPVPLLTGTATWCLARALSPHAGYRDVVGATALAWLAGFVAVPVPGGVGVREATFVAAASSLPGGVAAVVAIAARLAFMLADAGGALVASVALRPVTGTSDDGVGRSVEGDP
ncbi:MAG: lysylphosphatidylglycerol synthase domain-containing protein [Acidimicrobiales bacterium]